MVDDRVRQHDVRVSLKPATRPDPAATELPAAQSPQATRARARAWRDPRLVIGIALVAGSVLLGGILVGRADDTVVVWAARADLREGQPVRAADLVRSRVRFADLASADRYLSADTGAPDHATLVRDVAAGELVPRAALSGSRPASLTEVPLSVDAGDVPATVGEGSVVDVWVSPDPGDPTAAAAAGKQAAVLVFDDVSVVAAPHSGTSLGPSASRQVIVGLDGRQQAALPKALAELAAGRVVVTRKQ
jgi:hypothetical protein